MGQFGSVPSGYDQTLFSQLASELQDRSGFEPYSQSRPLSLHVAPAGGSLAGHDPDPEELPELAPEPPLDDPDREPLDDPVEAPVDEPLVAPLVSVPLKPKLPEPCTLPLSPTPLEEPEPPVPPVPVLLVEPLSPVLDEPLLEPLAPPPSSGPVKVAPPHWTSARFVIAARTQLDRSRLVIVFLDEGLSTGHAATSWGPSSPIGAMGGRSAEPTLCQG